jgi:hypothetical protein
MSSAESSEQENESGFEFVNQINSNFKFKKRRPSLFIHQQLGSYDVLKAGTKHLLGLASAKLAEEVKQQAIERANSIEQKWYLKEATLKPRPKIMMQKEPSSRPTYQTVQVKEESGEYDYSEENDENSEFEDSESENTHDKDQEMPPETDLEFLLHIRKVELHIVLALITRDEQTF